MHVCVLVLKLLLVHNYMNCTFKIDEFTHWPNLKRVMDFKLGHDIYISIQYYYKIFITILVSHLP